MKPLIFFIFGSFFFMLFSENLSQADNNDEIQWVECQKNIDEVAKKYPGQKVAFLKQAKILAKTEAIKRGYSGSELKIEIDSANYICLDSGLKKWSARFKAGNNNSYILFDITFNPFTNEFVNLSNYESDGH